MDGAAHPGAIPLKIGDLGLMIELEIEKLVIYRGFGDLLRIED